jgi:hypothetical protein
MDGIVRVLLHAAALRKGAAYRAARNRRPAETTGDHVSGELGRAKGLLQIANLKTNFTAGAVRDEEGTGCLFECRRNLALSGVEIIPIREAKSLVLDRGLQLVLELEEISPVPGHKPPMRVAALAPLRIAR